MEQKKIEFGRVAWVAPSWEMDTGEVYNISLPNSKINQSIHNEIACKSNEEIPKRTREKVPKEDKPSHHRQKRKKTVHKVSQTSRIVAVEPLHSNSITALCIASLIAPNF